MSERLMDYHYAVKMNTRFYVRSVGEFKLADGEDLHVKKADFPEIFWAVDGAGVFVLDGKRYILHPDQVWYYPPDSLHIISCSGKSFHYRWMALEGPDSRVLFEGLNLKPGINQSGPCPQHLFRKLTLNIEKATPEAQLENLACAFRILSQVSSHVHAGNRPIADQVAQIIEDNYSDPDLNVARIAELLQVNRCVLSRIFSASMKTTIVEYLQSRRLKEALRMLKETELPVHAIAEQCGYSSHNYFTKVIRKNTGHIPVNLRKE